MTIGNLMSETFKSANPDVEMDINVGSDGGITITITDRVGGWDSDYAEPAPKSLDIELNAHQVNKLRGLLS